MPKFLARKSTDKVVREIKGIYAFLYPMWS